jgi:DNA modification methylase
MKTIKTTLGEVRFCDCIAGMKELGDKSFDLCLTDPPYGVDLNRKEKHNFIDILVDG